MTKKKHILDKQILDAIKSFQGVPTVDGKKISGDPLVEPITNPKNPEKPKSAPVPPKENPKVKGPKEAKEEAERRMKEWEKQQKIKEKKEKKAAGKKPSKKEPESKKADKAKDKTPAPEKETTHAQDRLNALLFVATTKGDLEKIKKMFAKGADVNMRSIDRLTPLMLACSIPNPAIVEFLLQNGADPNAKTPEGDTAFSWMSGSGVDENPGSTIKDLLRRYGGKE